MSINELDQLLNNGMEVYRYYINPNVPLRKKILSPLREEKNPSFSLYPHKKSGIIFFTDHGAGDLWGNHYTFVMKLFNIDFKTAVEKIKQDVLKMNAGSNTQRYTPVREYKPLPKQEDERVDIMPTPREWNDKDARFFSRFKIPISKLNEYRVFPVVNYTLCKGERSYTIRESVNNPIYAISFSSGRYKIYRPLEKIFKWVSNTKGDVDVFGLDQLPEKCDKLFLMAGNKDVLSFVSTTGYHAIALNSESANLNDALYQFLHERSKNIYVMYDNDATGYRNAYKLHERFGFKVLNGLLKPYEVKDYADLVEKLTDDELEEFKHSLDSVL